MTGSRPSALHAADRSLTDADIASVPASVVETLRGAHSVLTICHENPESDALGSALAVALAVEYLGGRATPICADPVPEMYRFLPQIERFRREPDPDARYDLVVVSDCGELERIGSLLTTQAELLNRVPILNIDHHKSNEGFGAVSWVDPLAAATCEMVTLLLPALDVPVDACGGAIAANLMAGIVIDTAIFQHSNTTPRTLRAAAELVAAGAPLPDIARRLYRTKPPQQLKLFGRILQRLETDLDDRLVWSTLTLEDVAASGASPSHSEGLIDLLSQSEAADVVILFKEQVGETRISVRTRDGGVDATVLTATFGGGGHARAAGARVPLPLAEAIAPVLAEARRLIQAQSHGRA
jgi:bifunctional oligoribonuclease and PAP phosphatase NrnA